MFFKKRIRLGLIVVLLSALILGIGLGSVCAREIKRIVKVEVMADEEFRELLGSKYSWEDIIKEIVAGASDVFKEQIGICFEVIEIKKWQSKYPPEFLKDPFFELKARPTGAEIIIAFSGQKDLLTKKGWLAVADAGGRYILITDCRDFGGLDLSYILVHEIGHLFGAQDISNPSSAMNYQASWSPSKKFDMVNKEIILANLELDFIEMEKLRNSAQKLERIATDYKENCLDGSWSEDFNDLFYSAAENYLKAGELYKKMPLMYKAYYKQKTSEMYKEAIYLLKKLERHLEVREIHKKIGHLLIEAAQHFRRFGEKDKDWEAFKLYKEAVPHLEESGSKEEIEMIYQEYERLDKEYGWSKWL